MGEAEITEARLKGLMLSSLDGDATAYRQLLILLSRHLKDYFGRRLGGRSADIEDLVQETLIAIHDRRMTYDRRRPFTAWLYAIARHKYVDLLRRQSSRATVPIDMAEMLPAVETDHNRLDLNSALEAIPAPTRQLVRQVKLEGGSIAEAARTAGISESSVKVLIHRALRKLNARFSEGADERQTD